MFDVTTFLIRWLFLSNLARDVAEIQTLPSQPYYSPAVHHQHHHHHHAHPHPATHQPSEQPHTTHTAHPHPHHEVPPLSSNLPRHRVEEIWRDDCIRGLLSYPPGIQRLLVMDALRVELVQQLARNLRQSSRIMKRAALAASTATATLAQRAGLSSSSSSQANNAHSSSGNNDNNNDPFLEADVEILKAFGGGDGIVDSDVVTDDEPAAGEDTETATTTGSTRIGDSTTVLAALQHKLHHHHHVRQATLVISRNEANVIESSYDDDDDDDRIGTSSSSPTATSFSARRSSPARISREEAAGNSDRTISSSTSGSSSPTPPTAEEVREAAKYLRDLRNYLPQVVAAVLKAPAAFDPTQALTAMNNNPIQKLRQLLLRQCVQDPGFGVDLCWLLEAEVGRAWKTLFEHRQQTGRRLIVVLPAEKAAVLAKIGSEKKEAFDLLQDAEQSTAYGYTFDAEKPVSPSTSEDEGENDEEEWDSAPRLPSSLSLRRCSHFGDTMHFVDRLTKISLELRSVPVLQRHDYLQEALHEMNRRIRRRMVTRGDVSLDVEDLRGPHDWPFIEDLTLDMIHSSLHFPLAPQTGVWPNGETQSADYTPDKFPTEVVRVLNIVVPESRILASRERCPFLVHLEVADTNLEASDARLYASGVTGLGSTMEEALGMSSAAAGSAAATRRHSSMPPSYGIPEELLHVQRTQLATLKETVEEASHTERLPPRGGWQGDEVFVGDEFHTGYMYTNPYEAVRQHEYEELHLQMQSQHPQIVRNPLMVVNTDSETRGFELLDKVFGKPWPSKCQEIRDASPFGHVEGWRLASFIMKAGEDIRREALVMQLITKLRSWFQDIPEAHRPFLRPYTIMTVGGDAGMIECLSDAKSVDEVKKRTDGFTSLRDYFERAYGPPNTARRIPDSPYPLSFDKAQDNFLRSLVGYSLVCYILQIKDRHNANILLDREGHIMHIDFGFVLGDIPKMSNFPIFSEKAPFKLSQEFWEVLGGWNISSGGLGARFCKMFELAFECASTHSDEIATLVEGIMEMLNSNANTARAIANGVRHRLRMRGPHGSPQQKLFIVDLVNAALICWGTSAYDWLQRSMNGYQ